LRVESPFDVYAILFENYQNSIRLQILKLRKVIFELFDVLLLDQNLLSPIIPSVDVMGVFALKKCGVSFLSNLISFNFVPFLALSLSELFHLLLELFLGLTIKNA